MTRTIGDIGELALIERLKPFCATDAIGDDAALLSVRPNHKLVVTTDVLVEGVHFSDRTTPPYTVGWRSVAANLSDLAAMGAAPIGITVGLGSPSETALAWVDALYRGMADCLGAYGGAIYGGDLCRASQRVVSITALGEVDEQRAICRDGAVAGMSVVVTGAHGASRAGLAVLLGEIEASAHSYGWIKAHQMPAARFDVVARLYELVGEEAVVAGMDSSDGLANALLQLSESSGVGMDIWQSSIPLPEGLCEAVGFEKAMEWALYGGEDFELVLCVSNALADELVREGVAIAIGQTTPPSDSAITQVRLLSEKNSILITHQSFQHF